MIDWNVPAMLVQKSDDWGPGSKNKAKILQNILEIAKNYLDFQVSSSDKPMNNFATSIETDYFVSENLFASFLVENQKNSSNKRQNIEV